MGTLVQDMSKSQKTPVLALTLLLLCGVSASLQSPLHAQKPGRSNLRGIILPLAKSLGGTYYRLVEFYADGTRVRAPRGKLRNVRFLPISLASTNEMARGQRDQALVDPFEEFADSITMPDGTRLYRVESPGLGQGFIRITARGQFEILVWTANTSGFEECVAISNHDPHMAVVGQSSLPEYGGAYLLDVRLDGRVFQATSKPARGIPSPMNHGVKAKGLCFLKGALFANDGDDLYRLDLGTGNLTQVAFPQSNGLPPIYVDSTCTAARNGTLLAIGAGESANTHDIYTVSSHGFAVNQTNWAKRYLAASNNSDEGMLMALSPDGERLAYVLDYLYPFAYTADVQSANSPELFTGADFFPCYIDTIVGLGFSTRETLVFSAGSTFSKLDAYSLTQKDAAFLMPNSPLLAPTMRNLTKTSSTPQAPFLIDSALELKRRFTAGPNTFLTHEHLNGDINLQAVNGAGESLGIVSEGVEAVVPLVGKLVIVDEDPNDHLRIQAWDVTHDAVVSCHFLGLEDEDLIGKAASRDGRSVCFLVEESGAQRILQLTSNDSVVSYPLEPGFVAQGITFDNLGNILCLSLATSHTEIRTFDPVSETWIAKNRIPIPAVIIP
ncbi:MAG: hypothetical protein ACI97A_002834 [Planctomycetota bacterium]|jgi:hypothetical protein